MEEQVAAAARIPAAVILLRARIPIAAAAITEMELAELWIQRQQLLLQPF
jgi:hypothetical protein